MKALSKDRDNFLYLLLLAFVLVATSVISFSQPSDFFSPLFAQSSQRSFAPLPVLPQSSSFPILSAQAALAIDLNSGVSLYEKNPDSPLFPASTTKIVTALVAMDYYAPEAVLKVGRVTVEGQKMWLKSGEEISVSDLLYGLLVYSANDAAEVLAENYLGGREGFILAMNAKAEELSLTNTLFRNPTGLDGSDQVTTARDLTRVSEVAMKNPFFAEIVGTKEKTVTSVDGATKHKLTNINELLGKVPGVTGIKTGWTESARENLVTYLERDGHKIMIALLGSQDRFGETKELIYWIFKNYTWKEVRLPS
ncbi:D-alanyl-D-alanine carboxypeptidase [Candidatus Woesebacteria bacterium]|nr:D-alanyl-D-alanine carboxypeptidase [Candidatus Woesebacteria bacterium]